MCAIERHPDSGTRDSLTHTLFNLIKRPDEQQRRIIMDVGVFCVFSPFLMSSTLCFGGFYFIVFTPKLLSTI